MKKIGPKATKRAKATGLKAAGWIETPRGWIDPRTKEDWSIDGAWEAEARWHAQRRLERAGWKLSGGSTRDGVWMWVIEMCDPTPSPGEKRYCSLATALRRLEKRGG